MNAKSAITIIVVLLLAGTGILFFKGSSASAPTNTDAKNESDQSELSPDLEEGKYVVQPQESSVKWIAHKSFVDGYEDTGIVPIASGTVSIKDSKVASGTVSFDMTGITAQQTSNTNAGTEQLTEHLKSNDFFAVKEYPSSTLSVLSTDSIASTTAKTDYSVTADLTLKGRTNRITFPVDVGMQQDVLRVRGTMSIDRTRWGIRFGSNSFFDNLGDNAIADTVDVVINLQARQRSATTN